MVTIQINARNQNGYSGVTPNMENTNFLANIAENPVHEKTIKITITCLLFSICHRFFSLSKRYMQ